MTIPEVGEALERWTAGGRRAATATLVGVRRSAPRPPGARFAVEEGGEVAGSVSSGCVEGDLFERLQRVIAGAPAEVARYGITDEMAADVGLACGGEIDVLLAAHEPDDPAWRAARDAVEAGAPAVLFTGIAPSIRGRRLLVRPGGDRVGGLGSAALDRAAAERAGALLDAGGARLVSLEGVEAPEAAADASRAEALDVFAETFLPPPRLAIVGATPVAAALCHVASWLGWTVTVIDPRTAFADPEKFPEADRVLHAWPDDALEALGLDRYLDVVVLAHDRKLDVPALSAALRAGCRYVGQIGGRRTQRLRREALREEGLDDEALARIRGPVGLDIGADTPREIALSIASELVATRRGQSAL